MRTFIRFNFDFHDSGQSIMSKIIIIFYWYGHFIGVPTV